MKKVSLEQAICLGALVSLLVILCDKFFAWNMGVALFAVFLLLPLMAICILLMLAVGVDTRQKRPARETSDLDLG